MTISAPSPKRAAWALDRLMCRAGSRWAERPAVRRTFTVVSCLGDGWLWYGLMATLAACAGWRGLYVALHMAGTGFVAWLVYRTLKHRTRWKRPFQVHPGVVARVRPLDEYSFPSGHTLHAVSFSIVVIAWFPALAFPLIACAVLIAISRVVLGLHYPTDVLAGALLGAVLGAGSLRMVHMVIAAIHGSRAPG